MTEQITSFVQNHWMLIAAFIGILILLAGLEIYQRIAGIPTLSAQQATQMMNHQNAVILDLRPTDQFASGHIINAINIPQADLANQIDKLKNQNHEALIVTCQNGQTSLPTAKLLRKQGFAQVYMLKQGITGWRGAQLPLVKKS